MTISTSQLATAAAQMAEARRLANEQTIEQNMPTVLAMQQEEILKLQDKLASAARILSLAAQARNELAEAYEYAQAEIAALRAVAVRVNRFEKCVKSSQPWAWNSLLEDHAPAEYFDMIEALSYACAAGYLPADEVTK